MKYMIKSTILLVTGVMILLGVYKIYGYFLGNTELTLWFSYITLLAMIGWYSFISKIDKLLKENPTK